VLRAILDYRAQYGVGSLSYALKYLSLSGRHGSAQVVTGSWMSSRKAYVVSTRPLSH